MTDRNKTRDDPKVNVKVVLSSLWVSMLFVFALRGHLRLLAY